MNLTANTNANDVVIHKVGKHTYQYKKILDEDNCISYERLMSEEERKLTNQQLISKIIKQIN